MSEWRPVRFRDGYPPIEDHGLIGDGRGCALVGRDGAVRFMCVPRFDSPPVFCGLLDRHGGGVFQVVPEGLRASRQSYLDDTAVLITDLRTETGTVRLTDAFLLRPGARLEHDTRASIGTLVRHARVTSGSVDLTVRLRPRDGATTRYNADRWQISCPGQQRVAELTASRPLPAEGTTVHLAAGEDLWLALDWTGLSAPAGSPQIALDSTIRAWRRWSAHLVDDLPQAGLVRRSAITLKLLDHIENGAIIAAATSSLPERIAGSRNWDYRYAWIRDAAYTVFALRRIGLPMEAGGFLSWVLDAIQRGGRPRVLYDLDGRVPQPETIDEQLEGYRASAPVRWGNAAADQIQHDVYGEILDCAFQWAATGGPLGASLWHRLTALAEQAATAWQTPDHGIWEIRTPGRPFTYSAAMCQVALDRAARLARRLHLPGDADTWAHQARNLTDHILTEAWDDDLGALTEQLGHGGGLDASLLALPLRRVVPADHPRMIATTTAITDRLAAGDGLLFRYLPQESPDGIDEPEGAFVLCGFWLVDNLTGQGRVDEAHTLFDRLCGYASPLGLLAEQINPSDGSFLGNFPQALSHVGLISSAVGLARTRRGVRPELATGAWLT